MEPSGRNRWQPGANGRERRKRLRKAKTVAVRCDRLPEKFHGKEGSTVRVLESVRGLRGFGCSACSCVVWIGGRRYYSVHATPTAWTALVNDLPEEVAP